METEGLYNVRGGSDDELVEGSDNELSATGNPRGRKGRRPQSVVDRLDE